jgi:hypothetical protein
MRYVFAIVLILAVAEDARGQIARCRLAPRPYGFGGVCRLENPEGAAGQRLRLQVPDSVRLWMTAGPQDPPPWRGNLSLPSTEVAFEIASHGGAPSPGTLVFRTGLTWLLIREWRAIELAQPTCAACERRATDVLLVLDLVNPPPPGDDDIAILRSALVGLDRMTTWNRQEVQNCSSSDGANTGFFCLLYSAVEARMGRYHHRQPALELVRSAIFERFRDRITSHQLIDFNNHAATTSADLQTVLQAALDRALRGGE